MRASQLRSVFIRQWGDPKDRAVQDAMQTACETIGQPLPSMSRNLEGGALPSHQHPPPPLPSPSIPLVEDILCTPPGCGAAGMRDLGRREEPWGIWGGGG